MCNELIVYKPKKNIKKIILFIILVLFLSLLIFTTSVFSSIIIRTNNRWNKEDNANLKPTDLILQTK